MSWHRATLGDLGRVITGKTPSRARPDYFGDAHPFVTPADFGFMHYYCTVAAEGVSELGFEKHKNQTLPRDAAMCVCIGNTIGKCAIAPEPCLTNQQINSVVSNKNNDPKFLYYLLCNMRNRVRAVGLGGGAAQPIINKSKFSALEVRVPDLGTQQAIAEILSAYDDLIENNRRRIALLEEAARLLYREWFVHFRFPGHEHVKIIDGLPEGWESLELGRLCSLKAGGVFKPRYQGNSSGDLPFIKVRDMNSLGNRFVITEADNWVTAGDCDEFRGRPFPPGTSVFAKIGEALRKNRIRFLAQETLIDNNMMGAIPNRERTEDIFLYYLLATYDIASHASGAAVPFLSANILSRIRFFAPPLTVQQHFNDIAATVFQQMTTLQRQNTEAANARDLLLPRLMSGEITV